MGQHILDEIVAHKKKELIQTKRNLSLETLKKGLSHESCRSLSASLQNGPVSIIAEVKKASPSRGVLCRDFDPVRIAQSYEDHGARGISVLTEKKYFQGDITYLQKIRSRVSLPVLRKDFIVDPYQIYESRYYGADALLLIVRCLKFQELQELYQLTYALGMEALVEVHDEEELACAKNTGAVLLGVNNRDLETFEVSLETTLRLCDHIPDSSIVISESGIQTRADIERLLQKGVHCFLVGEHLMTQSDVGQALRDLL